MLIGFTGHQPTTNETRLFKCEGFTDAHTLDVLLSDVGIDRKDELAVTNGCGANEQPDEWFASQFAVPHVAIIHDADEAGQAGAAVMGPHFARFSPDVRNVVLTFTDDEIDGFIGTKFAPNAEVETKPPSDLRDWIRIRRRRGETSQQIWDELQELIARAPKIEPAEVDLPNWNNKGEKTSPGGRKWLGVKNMPPIIVSAGHDADAEDTAGEGVTDETEEEREKRIAAEVDAMAPVRAEDCPFRLARLNIEEYRAEHKGDLIDIADQIWKYKDGQYKPITDKSLHLDIAKFMDKEYERIWRDNEIQRRLEDEDSEPEEVKKVSAKALNMTLTATKAEVSVSDSTRLPSWLDDPSRSIEYISLKNGIVDIRAAISGQPPEKWLLPHSRNWFSTVKAPYEFDLMAECPTWLKFLDDMFHEPHGDPDGEIKAESIKTFQKWFGYILSGRNDLQKMLCIIGKARCGKGLSLRIIAALLGPGSVDTPKFNDLKRDDAMYAMHDKVLATITDARFSGKGTEEILEKILSVTGGDAQNINRKYKEVRSGVPIPTRFMIGANVMPYMVDNSAAFVNRCILLNPKVSYLGKEDIGLEDRIRKELPGILLWSIVGMKLLNDEGGKISQPRSGMDLLNTIRIESSPVSQFIRQRLRPGSAVEAPDVYIQWMEWSKLNDAPYMTKNKFSREFTLARPDVKKGVVKISGRSVRAYIGLELKPEDGSQATIF